MTIYLGARIQLPSLYTSGDLNDHVTIISDYSNSPLVVPDLFKIIVRRDFYCSGGPRILNRSYPSEEHAFLNPKIRRGWRDISEVSDNLSAEQALGLGRETAKKEGVVFYVHEGRYEKIGWHPEGWAPRPEGSPWHLSKADFLKLGDLKAKFFETYLQEQGKK